MSTGSIKETIDPQPLSCFDFACAKTYRDDEIADAQVHNPDLQYMRIICFQEYQGYDAGNNLDIGSGMAFSDTGPTTTGLDDVYAGHWLYKPYTTLTQGISQNTGSNNDDIATLKVADPTRLEAGQYAVIRRPSNQVPADESEWNKAEHVEILEVRSTTNEVDVKRGIKSTKGDFWNGAIIAQHQIGNANNGDPRNWAYNLSIECPLDGADNRAIDILSQHIAYTIDRDKDNHLRPGTAATLNGWLNDSDFHYFFIGGTWNKRRCDVDNDGVPDGGMATDGRNVWGLGVDECFRQIRQKLDSRVIDLGEMRTWIGDPQTFGLDATQSGQHESLPNGIYTEDGSINYDYSKLSHYISCLKTHNSGDYDDRCGDAQNKAATGAYPAGSILNPADPDSHSDVRLQIALATAFNQAYSIQNHDSGNEDAFRWYQISAVCDNPEGDSSGSNTYAYGDCIKRDDYAKIRQYKHWLGNPAGDYTREYRDETFNDAAAEYTRDDFTLDSQGKYGGYTSFGGTTIDEELIDGTSWLALETTTPDSEAYEPFAFGARGPNVDLELSDPNSGQKKEYTFCFKIKTDKARHVSIKIGGYGNILWVPKGESRQVFAFSTNDGSGTESAKIKFECGGDGSKVQVTQLRLFKSNPNVIRRNFDNGVVVANCTANSVDVDLDGPYYRKANDDQDPSHTGDDVDRIVTVPPFDGLILIKRPNP